MPDQTRRDHSPYPFPLFYSQPFTATGGGCVCTRPANDIWDYAVESRNWPVFPAYLGLGFFLRGEGPHPTPFGSLARPRTFGGVGAGSTTFFVDPQKQLSYAFLSTGLLEETRSTERHQYLADLVHGAIAQ